MVGEDGIIKRLRGLNMGIWMKIGITALIALNVLMFWGCFYVNEEAENGTKTIMADSMVNEWKGGSQPTAERAVSAAVEAEKDRLEFEKNNNLDKQ